MNSSALGNHSMPIIHGEQKWGQMYGITASEVCILTTVNIVIAIPGSVANGLMIACILLTPNLRETTTAILLLNLAIGDFFVCVVYQPLKILLMNGYISGVMNMVVLWLGFGLQASSLNGMLCLTVDRFISICYPFRYIVWMTEKRAHIMIAATWLVALVISVANIFPIIFAYLFVYIVIAFFLMLALQIAIFVTARRQCRQISSQFVALGKNVPYQHKPTRAISLVMGAFLLCWLPIMVTPVTLSEKAIVFSVCFTSLNSLLNPIICCWQIRDVKNALRKMLRLRPRVDTVRQPRARSRECEPGLKEP